MDRIGKLFKLVLGIALAAFAMSSMAAPPPKQFAVTASAVGPLRVSVTLTNTSPGNSSWTSFKLMLTQPGQSGPVPVAVQGPITLVHSATTTPQWAAVFSTAGLLEISNLTPVGKTESVTVTFGVAVTCGSSVNLTVNAAAWTGSGFTGDTFNNQTPNVQTTVSCDVILSSCEPPSTYAETSGGNTTTIVRLPKPGFPCDPTAFTVLFTDSDNTVEIQWTGQVVLKTTTIWPLSLVDPVTTQHRKTWVAWKLVNGFPEYIPVPTCTSDQAPTTAPITDPFPVFNSTATMPDGSDHPYVGERARICAIAERNIVLDPNAPEASSCPPQPSGLDPDVVLGCVYRETILFIRDDIFLSNR
jgi:hypothetical protein